MICLKGLLEKRAGEARSRDELPLYEVSRLGVTVFTPNPLSSPEANTAILAASGPNSSQPVRGERRDPARSCR
jgi:hypothetical protein